MTQPNSQQSTAELIEQTLTSLRAACQDLTQLAEYHNGITTLVQTAKGTALIHDLRLQINQVNKLLPFKS